MKVSRKSLTKRLYISFCVLSILTGITYTIIQTYTTGIIKDAFFVSLLLLATVILAFGVNRLINDLDSSILSLFLFVLPIEDRDKALQKSTNFLSAVINPPILIISGSLYATMISAVCIFILNVWKNNLSLQILMYLLLFLTNFCTGMAFASLISFFYQVISRISKIIKIDLWCLKNPSIEFVLNSTRKIAILASIYITMALSSILFSLIPISDLVILYSIFGGLLIIASIIVPIIPIVRKFSKLRDRTICEIENNIQELFSKSLDNNFNNDFIMDFEKLEKLINLRDSINDIGAWPFKLQSISTTFAVVLLSLIPAVIQVALDKYWPF